LDHPPTVNRVSVALILLGAGLILASGLRGMSGELVLGCLVLGLAIAVLESRGVELPDGARFSAGPILVLLATWAWGPTTASWSLAFAAGVIPLMSTRPVRSAAMDLSRWIVCAGVAGAVFAAVGPGRGASYGAYLASGVAFFLADLFSERVLAPAPGRSSRPRRGRAPASDLLRLGLSVVTAFALATLVGLWGTTGLVLAFVLLLVEREAVGRAADRRRVGRRVGGRSAWEEQAGHIEKLAVLGELAAGAAHEIRNPLTSIRGFMQILQSRVDPDGEEKEYLGIVMEQIDRIDEIINDLLLMARPSRLRLRECRLQELLDEVLVLVERDAAGASVRVNRVYDETLPSARLDPSQIKQVFLNLVRNAIEAMPGGGELTVATRSAGATIEVAVEDTGEGIPPEYLPKLFTPFFTTKESGTGMGLAISFGIVRSHGGEIEVESLRGRGTTFTVRLPSRGPAEEKPRATFAQGRT